jgi:hypothetical protein
MYVWQDLETDHCHFEPFRFSKHINLIIQHKTYVGVVCSGEYGDEPSDSIKCGGVP